ncbi:MAG: HAD-IIB family hydrolase [Desulfobacterales bacterium]|nr:HAD-IIB family hydrolase [Desulfobacterales bacterium]
MMQSHPKTVIFTDVDGTLIDLTTYSCEISAPAITRLVSSNVPVVLCSSKTFREQTFYRQVLKISDPFIVENGSAVFIPCDYFDFDISFQGKRDGYLVIELGQKADKIYRVLGRIRSRTGLSFQTYSDLNIKEISSITGLSIGAAIRASHRDYSQTITSSLSPDEIKHLGKALAKEKLAILGGGRFFTVTSQVSQKGVAASLLTAYFRRKLGAVVTVGIGDSPNDRTLLEVVDRAFLVQQPDGKWHPMEGIDVIRVPAPGPEGWCRVAEQLLAAV